MEKIYKLVIEMTTKRVEREKETKLSRTTFKMIALAERLYKTINTDIF